MSSRTTVDSKIQGRYNSTPLNDRLERCLSAYAAAAVAAGVSFLALPTSAEGRVIYTHANTSLPINGGPVPLDLNRDGVADFSFSNIGYQGYSNGLYVKTPVEGNQVWGRGGSFFGKVRRFASALRPGFLIGANKSYFKRGESWIMGRFGASHYASSSEGQWMYTRRRYLGMKFMINGRTHLAGPESI
jgi:hypothetical protein